MSLEQILWSCSIAKSTLSVSHDVSALVRYSETGLTAFKLSCKQLTTLLWLPPRACFGCRQGLARVCCLCLLFVLGVKDYWVEVTLNGPLKGTARLLYILKLKCYPSPALCKQGYCCAGTRCAWKHPNKETHISYEHSETPAHVNRTYAVNKYSSGGQSVMSRRGRS